jgi:hypothetical protein
MRLTPVLTAAIPARPDDSKTVFSQITQKTQIPYKKS